MKWRKKNKHLALSCTHTHTHMYIHSRTHTRSLTQTHTRFLLSGLVAQCHPPTSVLDYHTLTNLLWAKEVLRPTLLAQKIQPFLQIFLLSQFFKTKFIFGQTWTDKQNPDWMKKKKTVWVNLRKKSFSTIILAKRRLSVETHFSHFFRFFINLTEKAASEWERVRERERENDNFYSNSCVGTKP